MTILTWDAPGNRHFSAGVDRGVFYPMNDAGIAWNGLIAVKESIDTSVQTTMYVDGQKQVNQLSLGTFSASVEAFTYPDEFLPYDGYMDLAFSGQKRPLFNFSYRTHNGDDINGLESGYELHLVYNCLASPTSRANATISASADADTFMWSLTTTPVGVESARASSHFVIDSTLVLPSILSAIESMLYGTITTEPLFPSITDLIAIFEANALYSVVDNSDGSWTAIGPDEAFDISADGSFSLDWPWVDNVDDDTYEIKSY